MPVVPDIFLLDGLPVVGDTIGGPGTGADVTIDPVEQTATVAMAATAFAVTSLAVDFDFQGSTYQVNTIYDTVLNVGGSKVAGYVMEFQDTVSGDIDYVLLPADASGDMKFSTAEILSMTAIPFVAYDAVDIDNDIGIACYLTGTRIATPSGPVPIEALAEGDPVLTLEAGPLPVRRVLRFAPGAARGRAGEAIAIAPGALAPGLPSRTLVVSRQHRILLAGPDGPVFVPAKDLLDRKGVTSDVLRSRPEFRHILLDRHATVLAEGVPSETLAPAAPLAGASRVPDAPLAWPELHGPPARRLAATLARQGGTLVDPVAVAAVPA